MSHWWIYAIGFMAQALFSARLLIQWIASERVKKTINPQLFWELSLFASIIMFVYGWLREDFAIILGQSITYFIYLRNLHFMGRWKMFPLITRIILLFLPTIFLIYSFTNGKNDTDILFHNHNIPLWLLIWGSLAQIMFTMRFVYQWVYSEKRKSSHLPLGFWLISLTGSSMIVIYAIFRADPVLFLGQIFGLTVYARNIYFNLNHKRIETGN